MPEPLTRRHVVLGMAVGAAAAGVSGCTGDDDGEPSRPPVDADTTLVEELAADVAGAQAMVNLAAKSIPTRKRELMALRRVHTAHLEALGGCDCTVEPVTVTGMRQLVRQEQALQQRLVQAAVKAESGSLAKLLASMSAAVAQQLAVLR